MKALRYWLVFPFLCSCQPKSTDARDKAGEDPVVTVVRVSEEAVPDEISFVGRVRAERRVDLRAEVSGKLVERAFTEGSEVKKGDLLFKIEQTEYEVARDLAKAQVESAKASRDQTKEYLRRMNSATGGGISETELESAKFSAQMAEAVLDQAEANLASAELTLKRTCIHAPIDGLIGRAKLNVGNYVDASTGELASIVQMDPIRVEHSLSGPFVTQILLERAERDPALPDRREELLPRLTLSTGDVYPHSGKIVFLDNEINPTTGSIQGEAEFPNPERTLRPGQFVNLVIERGKPVPSILVPQAAVQQDREGRFLLIVSDAGEVIQRRVMMGGRHGPKWVIEEGVAPGEKVIVQGVEKVRPGARVQALEWEESAETTKPANPED